MTNTDKKTKIPQLQVHKEDTPYVVAALYKFVALPNFKELQPHLKLICKKADIYGTLLLAHEGINGTVAGTHEAMAQLISYLQSQPKFTDLDVKYSFAHERPFHRMKVRLKKEIVNLGMPTIDPTNTVGTYISPKDWNEFICDPNTIIIDTRNDYEIAIGTFENAINPATTNFRQFADYVENKLKPMLGGDKSKKIAMFCTGGIRCEKSTSYLRQEGFENVYHLKGGILKYLEQIPEEKSKWNGQCFVFDQRVSVGHGLRQGEYDMCHACRMPMTAEEKNHKYYRPGVSCPKCHGTHRPEQLKRFCERQKQVELANQRGQTHIGTQARQHRAHKQNT